MQPFPDSPADWRIASSDSEELPRYSLEDSIVLEDAGFSGSGEVILTLRRGDAPKVLLSPSLLRIEWR